MSKNKSVSAAALALLWSIDSPADVDLELSKSVAPLIPAVGQPVEFAVRIRNIHSDPAVAVVVHDLLPPELRIPAGMAPFTSRGTYDPVSGDWMVGDLLPVDEATLLIPAIVATANPPDCLVNRAAIVGNPDSHRANNQATAAIRTSPDTRCIDLTADFSAPFFSGFLVCDVIHYDTVVDVMNDGPDTALDVTVDLDQSPQLAPHLRFTGVQERNPNFDGATCVESRCVIARLGGGETIRLSVLSDDFRVTSPQTHTLTLTVSNADSDYAPDNNQVSRNVDIPPQSCTGITGGFVAASCFIATAAFGSPLEQHVVTLRHFRDQVLLPSKLGRAFVALYYRHSPPVATLIAKHGALRLITRVMLTPIILVIAFPDEIMIILSLVVLLLLLALRRSLALQSTSTR
jgi:uncharacterized repeat protein (TIGR01451 family)